MKCRVPTCGQEFTPTHIHQATCSQACRNHWRRIRQRGYVRPKKKVDETPVSTLPNCSRCDSRKVLKYGRNKDGMQRYSCQECKYTFVKLAGRDNANKYTEWQRAAAVQIAKQFGFKEAVYRSGADVKTINTWCRKFKVQCSCGKILGHTGLCVSIADNEKILRMAVEVRTAKEISEATGHTTRYIIRLARDSGLVCACGRPIFHSNKGPRCATQRRQAA